MIRCGSFSPGAVDQFAHDVEVTEMPGRFLQYVGQQPLDPERAVVSLDARKCDGLLDDQRGVAKPPVWRNCN